MFRSIGKKISYLVENDDVIDLDDLPSADQQQVTYLIIYPINHIVNIFNIFSSENKDHKFFVIFITHLTIIYTSLNRGSLKFKDDA